MQPIIKTDDLTLKDVVLDDDYIIGVDLAEADPEKATFKAKAINVRGKDAISINTISDMEVREGSYNGQCAILGGFDSVGDGGGGGFVWVSTSTDTAVTGMIVEVTGVAVGRWFRIYNGAINVRWTGAKGDSDGATGTDDTVAIQTAIDFLSYNGGEVYFPNGRYLVTTINPMSSGITVNIYPPTIAGGQINKVILSGDGYGSSELISIGGNVLEPIDRSDPIPATPARLTLEVKGLAITGDISVTDAQKTGKGFYADTTKISMSYIYFKDCMFKYHAEAFNYLGYEGTGPLADGHTIIENCIIADNTLGVITAVDNVMLVNNYISRNSYYGVWFREGRAIQVVGGKIQLNGQDNFGTGDIFTKAGQVLIGGTTQRDDNIGDIQFKSVYWESALESGNNPKHAFIDIEQEDTTARTMIVSNITIDGGFVNGKDCANFIRLENNCVVSNLTIKALQAVNFNLPDNSLVELLGGDARLLKADLSIDNDLSLKDDTDTSIPSDAVKLKTIYETNPNVNYNIKNQLGVKAVQVLGAAIADAATITTAVVAIQERAVYRITIDDVFISGGNETVNLPYVGLFVVTLFQEKQQDIVNTGYTITVDGSRNIVITNNTGGARQFGYTIERIL